MRTDAKPAHLAYVCLQDVNNLCIENDGYWSRKRAANSLLPLLHCLVVLPNETSVPAEEAQTRACTRLFAKERELGGQANARASAPQRPHASLVLMSHTHKTMSRADFARLEKTKSRRIPGSLFLLSASPLQGESAPRWACVVSKKIASRATVRNRIKRQCRESARVRVDDVSEPLALIFRAKKESVRATFADIDRDIRSLIEKLHRVRYNALS